MSEFWLISAPGDKENLQALERMNNVTSKSNLSHNTKFAIPDFKVRYPKRRGEPMDWRRAGVSEQEVASQKSGIRTHRKCRTVTTNKPGLEDDFMPYPQVNCGPSGPEAIDKHEYGRPHGWNVGGKWKGTVYAHSDPSEWSSGSAASKQTHCIAECVRWEL